MLAKQLAVLAALFSGVNAQASYGNPSWMSLPGSLYRVSEPWSSSADTSWPQSNIGQPLVPQAPEAELREMLAEIDVER